MIERLKGLLVKLRWARFYRRGGDRTWMHEPLARAYVNASVTGSEHRWPTDWLKDRFVPQPFRRGLSLGCGEGALERDLIVKEICTEIVGLDLLQEALDRARRLGEEAGLTGITYRRADLNRLDVGEDDFDVAFFHQSLHHVKELESCLAAVHRALSQGGLIYLDEYVGPARGDWRHELIAEAEAVYRELPPAIRRSRKIGFPIDRSDPSEAVRSSEILASLEPRFEIVERRDYGGNLLALIHPHLRHERLGEPEGVSVLEHLIEAEKQMLARGEPSYYVVLVGKRR